MAFNSLTYFLFLPLIWIVYQLTPDRLRWLLLLAASLGFYAMLKAPYLLVVLGLVAGVTYSVGVRLGRCSDDTGRKRLLWIGVGANLLVLISLKYLPAVFSDFHLSPFTFDLSRFYSPFTHHFSLLITIGISYYVFQAISYLADIYLEIIDPEPHFGYLFLSLAFFPKLLQGPIERSGGLLPQLKKPYVFDYDMARSGLILFAWGLFKKVVVADRLALYVNTVYGDVHTYTGLPLILATYCYAFQIYYDFSGYTDMALGSARLFNINLTQNFNSPYLATSVADFWRRWHISFSRWILDYIFKPLQMSWRDWGTAGTAAALLVTFLVSGIWHGASWGFVVWGVLHGVYLAASVYYRPWQKKIHKALGIEKTKLLKIWQTVVTFNLVCFAWIFFRADSLQDAFYLVNHALRGIGTTLLPLFSSFGSLRAGKGLLKPIFLDMQYELFIVIVVILISFPLARLMNRNRFTPRYASYLILILIIVLFGYFTNTGNFIYTRF